MDLLTDPDPAAEVVVVWGGEIGLAGELIVLLLLLLWVEVGGLFGVVCTDNNPPPTLKALRGSS